MPTDFERAESASSARRDQRGGRQEGRVEGLPVGVGRAALDARVLLDLQRLAGNRAAAAKVVPGRSGPQRRPLPSAPVVVQRKAAVSDPLLVEGSRGHSVKKLQERLNVLGASPPLTPDGIFGKLTRQAVLDFQQAHFTDPKEWDGKVGDHTWTAIDTAYRPPEISATEQKLGEDVKAKMDQMNYQDLSETSGVWYFYNYRSTYPERFKPDMESGYADPRLFDKEGFMTWRVKPRVSAAAALQSWLRGLTIAECYTAMIAAEFDALRAAVGDEKFDARFGSTDRLITKDSRMLITNSQDTKAQISSFLTKTGTAVSGDAGQEGNRPAQVGEWYYFMNHPKYLLKHPGGAWQGENSIYVGREGAHDEQMWEGLGTSGGTGPGGQAHVTEGQILHEMVLAYNRARDQDDDAALAQATAANGGVLPSQLDPASGAFPDQVTSEDILDAPPERLDVPGFIKDTTDRKGGFWPKAGRKLDVGKVQALRGTP